jgi:hypothetical protein
MEKLWINKYESFINAQNVNAEKKINAILSILSSDIPLYV